MKSLRSQQSEVLIARTQNSHAASASQNAQHDASLAASVDPVYCTVEMVVPSSSDVVASHVAANPSHTK